MNTTDPILTLTREYLADLAEWETLIDAQRWDDAAEVHDRMRERSTRITALWSTDSANR